MLKQKGLKPEQALKNMLSDFGHSEKVAAELWKWYNHSKKGVASF